MIARVADLIRGEHRRTWDQNDGPSAVLVQLVRAPWVVAGVVALVLVGLFAVVFGIPPISPLFAVPVLVAPIVPLLRAQAIVLEEWRRGEPMPSAGGRRGQAGSGPGLRSDERRGHGPASGVGDTAGDPPGDMATAARDAADTPDGMDTAARERDSGAGSDEPHESLDDGPLGDASALPSRSDVDPARTAPDAGPSTGGGGEGRSDDDELPPLPDEVPPIPDDPGPLIDDDDDGPEPDRAPAG